ncbi:MAG: hypothetical protein SNG38_01580 [Rikenellaceae bacterium]
MNLFKFNKLKTPLLLGAMLLSVVACSDYDDEIGGLSDRIDAIEGTYVTISSMESQIAAVTATIPDLTSIYNRLDALEGELEGVDLSELQAAIDGLNATIETSIESVVTTDFLTEMLDNVYLTEITLAQIQALLGDENEGLIADIVSAMAAASQWVGNDALADYLLIEDAYTNEDALTVVDSYFEEVKETLIADVAEKILSEEITLSSGAVTTIQSALENLTSRVAELEGRIQSLIFVPETADKFAVKFAGKDYVKFGEEMVYLAPVSSTRELTFQVSPASWAGKFTTENVTLYSVEYTRAEQPFTIVDVVASEEGDGKFTVSLIYNFDDAVSDYGHGIALHIDMEAVSGSTSSTDFITEYVSVDVEAGEDVASSIYYGKYEGDMFIPFAGVDGQVVIYDIEEIEKSYDYTETINFLDGCDWYVLNDDTLVTFASLYDSPSLLSIKEPTDEATLSPSTNESSYELTATSATIISGSADLIGDVITSGEYLFALTYGDESISLGSASTEITVVERALSYEAIPWNVMWTYASGNAYTSAASLTIDGCISISDSMSAEMFNEMYVNNNNISTTGFAKIYAVDGVEVPGASAEVVFFSAVNGSSDVKPIQVVLSGMPTETAEYLVVYTDPNVFSDNVEIEVPISFTGMPVVTGLDLGSVSPFSYIGQTSDVILDNLSAELWAVNKDAFEGHISEAEFESVISSIILTGSDGIRLRAANDVLSVRYANFAKFDFDTPYELSLELNDSVFGDAFTAISATVTLENNLRDYLQVANAFVDANGNVEIMTELLGVDNFDVIDKDLLSTHTFNVDANVTGEVKLVYSVVEDLDEWSIENPSSVIPTVENGVLVWGDWDSPEISMIVEAYVNDILVANNEFIAYITSPLGDEIVTEDMNLYIEDLTGSVDLDDAISLMLNKDGISENVFLNYMYAFGSDAPEFTYAGTNDSTTPSLVEIDADNVVSFSSNANTSVVMQKPVEYYYDVTFQTYLFGTIEGRVTVVVNENGASAPVVAQP